MTTNIENEVGETVEAANETANSNNSNDNDNGTNSNATASAAVVTLQTLPKGKGFESYELGDYRVLDMAIPAERSAALVILEHIVNSESDPQLGGFGLYFDKRLEDVDSIVTGSIAFDGKTVGTKAEQALAMVSATYIPAVDEFYHAAQELTRRALQRMLSGFVSDITRKYLKIDDEGKLVVKDGIPIDPKDLLSFGNRVVSKDPFQWLLLAIAQLKLSQQIKIKTTELRMCLTSSSYARNSAFRSLEESKVFTETLASIRKMLLQTENPEFMEKTVRILKKAESKRADEITAEFITAWRNSQQIDRVIADRDVTDVKRKAAEKLNETEKEALAVLFDD